MKTDHWTKDQILAAWKAKDKALIVTDPYRGHKDFSTWHATHMDERPYTVQITNHEIIVHWR